MKLRPRGNWCATLGAVMAGAITLLAAACSDQEQLGASRQGIAMVVTTAMITSIAKSGGEITLRSRPTLSTTSSIRPRVFIRIPSEAASRHGTR